MSGAELLSLRLRAFVFPSLALPPDLPDGAYSFRSSKRKTHSFPSAPAAKIFCARCLSRSEKFRSIVVAVETQKRDDGWNRTTPERTDVQKLQGVPMSIKTIAIIAAIAIVSVIGFNKFVAPRLGL
jgi:hypothetical protein